MNPKAALYFLKCHGPAILTVLGCVGVPVTALLASKATLKSVDDCLNDEVLPLLRKEGPDDLLDPRYKIHLGVDLTEPRCIKAVWKNYILTAISATLTIAAIIGSNRLSAKEIAMLSASCAGIMSYKARLEQEIRSRYGDAVLKEMQEKAMGDYAKVYIYPEDTGKGDLLCYEAYGGRWFYSSEEAVRKSLDEFNERFINGGSEISRRFFKGEYLCLNDLYDMWGITTTHFGHQYGWAPPSGTDYDYYDGPINWDVEKLEGFMQLDEPVLVIEPATPADYPMMCWQEV